jgi:hypothetical protein
VLGLKNICIRSYHKEGISQPPFMHLLIDFLRSFTIVCEWNVGNSLMHTVSDLCAVIAIQFWYCTNVYGSQSSSISIVSDYGLDDQAIEVRSQAEARDFFLTSVSRPALGPTQPPLHWVPGVLSPGVKYGRGVTLTTHPHLVLGVVNE